MTTIVLPPYTPPPPVPSYSPKPADDESIVAHTPRIRELPTGSYIQRCGNDAVVLADQDPAAEIPSYGRQGLINGFVSVEERETVSEIVLKVKGKMDFMISEGGSMSTKLFNDSFTLWSSQKASTSVSPSAVPFSVPIRGKFEDENLVAHPLPPSYEIPWTTVPGLYFKSSYSISVTITRSRSRKLQFLNKSRTITIPFEYVPRLRPWRPIQPFSDLRADVKAMPEEFRQLSWEVSPRPKSTALPLDLHLFLPAVEIFGLDDTIPFHVQLSGSVSALQHFVSPHSTHSAATKTQRKEGLSVSLVRQVAIEINGRRASRAFTLASAALVLQPPSYDSLPSLDFSGSLRPHQSTQTGMFDIGAVRVHDFVVVELWPIDLDTLHGYQTLRYSHAVKLVTDSWVDAGSSAGSAMARFAHR
ncbi:hypothetical protein MIND_00592400 [Mycena indigotica]|uniref:Uncharacterized protein n=1 Tax=Mycena indigotica TaxID=2126181 RepID=A0A8H6W5J6_9AGAR|nr:uncharacterized protein MIND_00592400 [Mycena indigotica]KAF7303631.1 hypothetical protein MIND_00592400 [Mycena indigotica]